MSHCYIHLSRELQAALFIDGFRDFISQSQTTSKIVASQIEKFFSQLLPHLFWKLFSAEHRSFDPIVGGPWTGPAIYLTVDLQLLLNDNLGSGRSMSTGSRIRNIYDSNILFKEQLLCNTLEMYVLQCIWELWTLFRLQYTFCIRFIIITTTWQ